MDHFTSPLDAPPPLSDTSSQISPHRQQQPQFYGVSGQDIVDPYGQPQQQQQQQHMPPPSVSSSTTTGSTPASDGFKAQPASAAPSVSAACLACRSKHLKCDGSTPCSRCRLSNSECKYIASRRGYKGPRRNPASNPNKRHAADDSPPSAGGGDSCPMLLGASVGTPATPVTPMSVFNPAALTSLADAPPSPYVATPFMNALQPQVYQNPYFGAVNGALMEAWPRPRPLSIPEQCIESFYTNFFPGHPAVLPKTELLKLSKRRNLEHLLTVMRWAGSQYIDVDPSVRASFYDEAMRLIHDPDVVKDGFLVQAMIILLITLDGETENEQARDVLNNVEGIAINIRLYQRSFATEHGEGNRQLEESWRRTWWDLFVVSGMIAGVHRQSNFLLFDIMSDVALPCEEHEYLTGAIPTRPMYLEDFDDQIFTGDDREFSSFAYRVAAIRNLGRMMRLPNQGLPTEENVDKIETQLSNWRMHLPPSKKDSLNKHCQPDEMMFQAHMIIHACSINLHQPLSQLDTSAVRSVTACAPHRAVPGGSHFNIHTRHILQAAGGISKMVTYNVPITAHTHFFTCVLTLSSIVHLSKWALYFLQDQEEDLRQQVRLNLGALGTLSGVWKAAGRAGGQVKGVAQEIYRAKKAQSENPSFWAGWSQEEILGSMASDDGIMGEVEGLLGA